MSRQVYPLIDLRTSEQREGITRTQQTAQAIANIFKTAGAAEQKRRESQILDRITRAMSSGATAVEAISTVSQTPEFSSGISGALQKFGGMFQPSPGGMGEDLKRAIIGQALTMQDAFTLKPGDVRYTGAGKPIAAVHPEPISPTQQIAQQKLNKIYELQAKVKSGKATENEKAMLEKMLAGQPMVQIGLGQPASAAERTNIAETRASIDALDNLKNLFDNVQTKTGPITGRVSPIAGLVGMTTDEQEAFMAATSAFKNAIIKEITGAQMSEQEANRIMKQVPDITDPTARWKAKWQQSKKNLEMLQKRRMQILEQSGLRVPLGEQDVAIGNQGQESITSTDIPEDIHNMSTEDLLKIAGIPAIGVIPSPERPVGTKKTEKGEIIPAETKNTPKPQVSEEKPASASFVKISKKDMIVDKLPKPTNKKAFKNTLSHISNRNVAISYYEKWSKIIGVTESFDDLWKPISGKK